MAHSRSRLGQKNLLASPAVPSPSRRRVTRSQSRELDQAPKLSKNHHTAPSHPSNGRNKWGQNKGLSTVVEESPFRSPHKPGVRYGNAVIPESPEDVVNISGTTILPSEPDNDLDPEMMLEVLPDLERAGRNLLDFLAPSTANPVNIVNKAKQLGDPRNTESRRLRRLITNLDEEVKFYGNETYLDAERLGIIFFSALAGRRGGVQKDWSPNPVVHMANCARFAAEILLANVGTNSPKRAIANVEALFPKPFMDDLVEDDEAKAAGDSSLEKDTFDLALEIRTQALIIQLEDHQDDPQFDAKNAVRTAFFVGTSRTAALRGFNLPIFGGESGALPAQYRDIAQDRFNEILLSERGDGSFDVEELKGAYRWPRFVLRAAQWIRKRTAEISNDLENHMSAQDVHDAFFTSKHPSFTSTVGGSEGEPSTVEEAEEEPNESEVGEPAVSESAERPQDSRPSPRDREKGRRLSKPSFLNALSIQRIAQRQERLRSATETSDSRRHSDIGLASQQAPEQSSSSRRQTLPARPDRPPQADEPREIPASPEDSPTLLHGEDEFTIGVDTHLAIGNEGTQLEKSHSPPVRRTRTPPQRHRPSRALSQDVWHSIKMGSFREASSSPSRIAPPAFIDRQHNAERVSPISQDVEAQSAVGRVEARVSRKRAREVSEESEGDEEEEFSNYTGQADIDRRRAEKPRPVGNKRQRVEEPEPEQEQEQVSDDDDLDESIQASPRRRQPGWVPSRQASRDYLHSVNSSSSHQRWSPAEDKRLLRLIEELGCGWARIARQNEALPLKTGEARIEGRNQVQLKDRARNLKIKFLRESIPLPRNFDKVTMKAKDYDMLEKRGIDVPRP
ncbi:hypothetical protein P175DRAFT_0500753 [Aspergillus ochraceoroseus IBT 24754]|uniref:Uncharacterized protein n=1 Tax=Aspergillus ochraceoroseus IBT 24754 TaxID=1392256 RepID=A0A2T5M021_9EURO|nr:uncharacterized protein P175DRAFT_0500753 [Aspergillus ochraceoroseus IBT 24754]PTU21873.1 hypothetical protein P175DRAFT_0500753 [Aspergillus ochraceoroseus IBT 24754]